MRSTLALYIAIQVRPFNRRLTVADVPPALCIVSAVGSSSCAGTGVSENSGHLHVQIYTRILFVWKCFSYTQISRSGSGVVCSIIYRLIYISFLSELVSIVVEHYTIL
jgi:hypothetical protein